MEGAQLQPFDGTADDLLRDRIALALMGFDGGIKYWLAWGYVGLRIVHSLIQATVNIVLYRFLVFTLAHSA